MNDVPERLGFAQWKRGTSASGIRFEENGTRTLWLNSEQIAEGKLPESFEMRDYFYHLRFLDDFPEVTHWAFGDAWTQRVLLKPPRRIHDELVGVLLFGSEEDTGAYIVSQNYDDSDHRAPIVQTPMPSLFDKPLNLPLRIVIAKMILAALDDSLPYDQWHFVSSLLPKEEVAEVFVSDMAAAYGFRIRGVANDLRQALCELQGIRGEEK